LRKSMVCFSAMLLLLMVGLTACGGTTAAPDAVTTELVLYTGRNESLVKPVIAAFTAKTGIKVVTKAAGAAELANLIIEEKSNPKADVYISNDAGSLERMKMEKVLEAYTSDNLRNVPGDLKADNNTWYAVTMRARVIMYNKALVSEAELPKSLKDLSAPKWKGQVGMATGANESVIANVTALRMTWGEQATETFLNDLRKNEIKIYKGHGDVRQAVGRGEVKLGWLNHYYYHQQLNEKENNNVGIIYPDQSGDGVTVNVSGAAIVKGAKNMANAKAFLDFLLTPETQKLFAEVNYEYPVLAGVAVKDALALDKFKRQPVPLGKFGTEWDKSTRMIDQIGMVLR